MADTPSAVDLSKSLKGMNFPAKRDQLVKHAKDHGADDKTLDALKGLPQDEFNSMADVEHAYAQER
jgi:hypothetical protein